MTLLNSCQIPAGSRRRTRGRRCRCRGVRVSFWFCVVGGFWLDREWWRREGKGGRSVVRGRRVFCDSGNTKKTIAKLSLEMKSWDDSQKKQHDTPNSNPSPSGKEHGKIKIQKSASSSRTETPPQRENLKIAMCATRTRCKRRKKEHSPESPLGAAPSQLIAKARLPAGISAAHAVQIRIGSSRTTASPPSNSATRGYRRRRGKGRNRPRA